MECLLSVCRPTAMKTIPLIKNQFSKVGAVVDISHTGGVETIIPNRIKEEVLLFSRMNEEGRFQSEELDEAVNAAVSQFNIKDIFFLDVGGTSLALSKDDVNRLALPLCDVASNHFIQSLVSSSLAKNLPIYHAVLAPVWLNQKKFKENLELIEANNGYYGRVNLKTGQQDKFKLGNIFQFTPGCLDYYLDLAEHLLQREDEHNHKKVHSCTCAAIYNALRPHYGFKKMKRPCIADLDLATTPEDHCWLYFFDARVVAKLRSHTVDAARDE